MSSSTITVKPRRKTAQSPPPTAQSTNQNKGTVLLRNPLPRYSFDQKSKTGKSKTEKKISVESDSNKDATDDNLTNAEKLKNSSVSSSQSNITEPVAVCKLVASFPQNSIGVETLPETSFVSKPENCETGLKDKPVNKVGPISKTLTHSVSDSVISVQNNLENGASSPQTGTHNQETHVLDCDSGGNQSTSTGSLSDEKCKCSEKIKHLEEEKQLLKNQLEVQLQVNQELKKLLVASVGDDLQHRVERLTRDKAQMSMEIGDYFKKMSDDYEHLDKISIQADMWRSKYLACRVMADELASSKAFYSSQFEECQIAIQKLLNERHQLRTNLYDTYRGLTQIQEAFDPLGSLTTGSKLLTSKCTIDLARTNQHLVDTIKYRLLPSHVTSAMNNKLETDWHDYLTPAEIYAQELLTREMRPEDFRCLIPARSIMAAPGAMSVDRFHPCANYDNLTLNVCCKCKGEISIV
ncbi:golgin-45-like [Ruditapes philippinarum]|uniref:golgin-45-like n=1 Tax=Ruditapes philippinarum TaxID=129788 RepID=UPI00295BC4FD|nr:golgin-45-like [Ruditapes philippinarum]XP_060573482.1 golgin-45-like [Ruditapes philippinarum]